MVPSQVAEKHIKCLLERQDNKSGSQGENQTIQHCKHSQWKKTTLAWSRAANGLPAHSQGRIQGDLFLAKSVLFSTFYTMSTLVYSAESWPLTATLLQWQHDFNTFLTPLSVVNAVFIFWAWHIRDSMWVLEYFSGHSFLWQLLRMSGPYTHWRVTVSTRD